MIRISVTASGQAPILAMLDRVARPDLMPLAETIRGRLVEFNRAGLRAGTDASGRPMAPLAESTLADPRRGGDGPPLVPRDAGSRMIADFESTILSRGGGSLEVVGTWPDLARYHRRATPNRPARDPVGIRPDDWLVLGDDARDFARNLMRF